MNNRVCQENFFIFKGASYGVGTQVVLKDEVYLQRSSFTKYDNLFTFQFGWSDGYKEFSQKGNKMSVVIRNPDQEIKEIISPVAATPTTTIWQQQALENMCSGKVHADVFGGVLLYIIVMLVGAIFYDRWLIWIFSTFIFVSWLLNQYRN